MRKMAVPRLSFVASLLVLSSLIAAAAADYGSGTNPEVGKALPIGVQGIIMCKSADKYYPIQGATVRVTCVKVGEKGVEIAPVSVISSPSDANGYFLATLFPWQLPVGRTVTKCKAFLHRSPVDDCDFPTDVNKGVRGQPLSSFRILHDKQIKLYTVGPFYFTSEPTFY